VQRATAKDVLVPKVRVVDRSYSESVPTGRVLAQDPAPGERIVPGGALLVSVSRGSAFAAVPSVAGLDSRQAVSLLERAGFVTNRRFAPSTEIEAWHALTTEPAAGTRVERPVTVTLIVSTGPPRIPIPRVAGRTADDAAAVLRDAGFVPVVQERRSNQAPGTILRLDPAAGARTLVGSTVTIVVAREPLWTPLTEVTGEESIDTGTVALPTGARLRLETENGSFLDLAPATVSAVWTGDADGAREIDAGDDVVLLEPTRDDRTVAVTITVTGDAAWRLVVETAR
jgi:serine/threonine-protein kinase